MSLKEECNSCMNLTNCSLLASKNCRDCPELLVCPPEILEKGFEYCGSPMTALNGLTSVCNLKQPFYLKENTRANIGCLRCGKESLQVILEDEFDYLAKLGLEDPLPTQTVPTLILTCVHCFMRTRYENIRSVPLYTKEMYPVFQKSW